MGPAVSCVWLIGTIPLRETSPTVGFSPTKPFMDAGQLIEPSVSVPMAAAAMPAATAAADPELDPHAVRSSAYGLRVSPPTALHPLLECSERMFAHSDRLVRPRITAPARVRFSTTVALASRTLRARASDPAVVGRPAISML